jgi:hypothetical protein
VLGVTGEVVSSDGSLFGGTDEVVSSDGSLLGFPRYVQAR